MIVIKGTKITHLHFFMLFGKPHMATTVARMVWLNANGAERQPPWTILKNISTYDSYESKQRKLYVSSHAKRFIITFGQPLGWKTLDTWKWVRILYKELCLIVLRLGFHTMSFFRTIGHVITHLLEQLVELYYEITSGIISLTMLTDIRSLSLIKENSDISLYDRYE